MTNALFLVAVAVIGFGAFFYFEDFIYDFDYGGHWVRALTIKQRFLLEPLSIPKFLHLSLNNDEYFTYLIAFFQIPIVMLNESMGFFCFGTFIWFFVPVFILLQVLYFTHYEKYASLPLFTAVIFYQMYFSIFCGETECFGSFCIVLVLMLTIFTPFKDIDWIDNLAINLFMWVLIFGRRFYLYTAVTIYLSYFIHYLNYYHLKIFNKEAMKDFLIILSSGLLLLLVCLTIYQSFFVRVLTNNYVETYAYNNRPGKILAFVAMFSVPVLAIAFYGLLVMLKQSEKRCLNIELLLLLILPTAMFWRIQSFEYHHYYLISFSIIVYFSVGFYNFLEQRHKHLTTILCLYLMVQSINVFVSDQNIPFFYTPHKVPKVYPKKEQVIAFVEELERLTNDGSYIYMATGDGLLNYSVFSNALLPKLSALNFETNVNEIIDGFPSEMKNCRYVVISTPTLHQNWDYQNMYDIITYAIEEVSFVKKEYTLVSEMTVNYIDFKVYELTGEYTKEIKEYYYRKMLELYPQKADWFSNILD